MMFTYREILTFRPRIHTYSSWLSLLPVLPEGLFSQALNIKIPGGHHSLPYLHTII